MLAHMVSLLALALAVSLDGFGVGVTYGLRGIRIPLASIAIIAVCSGAVIWLSMLAGGFLSEIGRATRLNSSHIQKSRMPSSA